MSHRACNIYHQALYRKKLPAPGGITKFSNKAIQGNEVPPLPLLSLSTGSFSHCQNGFSSAPCLCKTSDRSKVWGRCMWSVESRSHAPTLAAREAGNLNITQSASTQTYRKGRPIPRKGFHKAAAKTQHRRGMWSVDKQPQPNWVVFIFCGSTQTLGFLPTWPIRGVNRCQYLLSLVFYLFTFIFNFPLISFILYFYPWSGNASGFKMLLVW